MIKLWILLVIFNTQAELTRRVIQGAPIGRRPWMVHLRYTYDFFCGGVIYSESTVITAAHCTKFATSYWTAHINRFNIDVEPDLDHAFEAGVIRRINHPQYNPMTFEFDVSIWTINAVIHNYVPVVFPKKFDKFDNVNAIGWGETRIIRYGMRSEYYSIHYSSLLNHIRMPLFDANVCTTRYPHFNPNNMLCTGDPGHYRGVCYGDSGGPLYRKSDSSIILLGLISHSWGCGDSNFHVIGTSTRSKSIKQFIRSHGKSRFSHSARPTTSTIHY